MAKMVSRTVKVYHYTFVKMEKREGQMVVSETKEIDFLEKLAQRKAAEYIKQNPEMAGFVVGSVEETEQLYAMSLEAFLQNAEPVYMAPKAEV